MPFSATRNVLGNPDFKLIHIDAIETAKAFQEYLDTASKLTGVSLDDISTAVTELPDNSSDVTLAWLIDHGMRLFDAVVWLTAGRPTSHPLTLNPIGPSQKHPSLHEVARAVFYCYFFLVTQARYPAGKRASKEEKPKVPNFLRSIMGMEEDQEIYVSRVCTFEASKFDPAWVKHVSFANFGRETLSRFGLGVAGYRSFGPFGLYDPKPDMPAGLRNAFAFAKSMAKSSPTWDIHPLTREPTVLTKRGNLNKNLANLMLDCFSDAQLREMEAAKVIYKRPEREPNHMDYKQWDAEDDISGNSKIFPSE